MKRFSLRSCSVFSMKRFDDHGFASSSTNSFIDRSNGDLVESISRRVGMFLFNISFFMSQFTGLTYFYGVFCFLVFFFETLLLRTE